MAYCIGFIVTEEAESEIITQEVFPAEVARREVLVQTVRPGETEEAAQNLLRAGAQALVARGGNFRDLQKSVSDVPLVELVMRTPDVLQALNGRVEDYDQIWLVLSKFVRFDFDSCRALLPAKVHCFRYGPVEEMLAFLASLDAPLNTLIIGSGFVLEPARLRGFHAVQIRNSPDGVRESCTDARNILRERDKEAAKARQIATILSNIEDGVVVLDDRNRVTLCNRKGEELLGLSFARLKGRELTALLPAFAPVQEAYRLGKRSEQLVQTQEHSLSVNMSPVTDLSDGVPVGGVLLTLRDVTKLQELEKNLRFQLSKKGLTARYRFEDILTKEESMHGLIQWARDCARSDNTVMIYGESGTGKELFAQSIHNASPRRDYPFVAVNCAALTENLLESELFGYVAGAFTGARKEGKAGLFELAHRGTIFLDEVNSMSPSTQAKILRVIEQKEVMRLGSDYIIPLDVRIITAANENLIQMVKRDAFRRDLFFRLNVLEVRIPPLNQRPKDILFLFRSFVSQLQGRPLREVKLSPELERALLEHNWWGNVRELRNAAQRYTVRGSGAGDDLEALFPESPDGAEPALVDDDLHLDLRELDRVVEGLVIQSLFNRGLTKTQTAKALGISRTALFKKLEGQKERQT